MPASFKTEPVILWWGRADNDYSRNRILRQILTQLGYSLQDFQPHISPLADWEAAIHVRTRPDLVWVPCFRQRDVLAARRWSRRRQIPLVFDPLISAYDKQVNERRKFPADSRAARRLLAWEKKRLCAADCLLCDTPDHALYFQAQFDVPASRTAVVWVGAEEGLFQPKPLWVKPQDEPLEVLYYGSFIQLQAPQTIVEAAHIYRGPPVRWTLLGDGPLRARCEQLARGLSNVRFEPWIPYPELPHRIHQADILLGVFSRSDKAGRVIPNKVFQALACGRPVVTRQAPSYPQELQRETASGIEWVEPENPKMLAETIARLAGAPDQLPQRARQAAATYLRFFSVSVIRQQVRKALELVRPRSMS